ncbi:DUF6530 family protein [Paenibacillus hubeiensis]|uniref:DUF6530 family protein n=1 Tax=Paenibacillus hubeiensis TaxID=3077330 RepID=UPI0031BACF7F
MKSPTQLHHQPVIASDRYEQVDGVRAGNKASKRLTLGVSREADTGREEISAILWSQLGGDAAESSEPMLMHRVLDLSILICQSLEYFQEAYRYEHLYDPAQPVIQKIGLQGSAMTVAVCTENDSIREDIQAFSRILNDDGEMIGERLRTLSAILKEMGY